MPLVSKRGMTIVGILCVLVSLAGPPQETSVVRLEPAVAAANLQSKVAPEYPPLARAARVQSAVSLQLAIGKDGRVSDAKVARGHALLNDAAVRAVQQWQYKAHEVNGAAAEVTTTVTIHFVLTTTPGIPSGTASITGRVLRADGIPAARIQVDVALPPGQTPSPSTSFTEVSGEYRLEIAAPSLLRAASLTDDSGEYHIFRLGPGTYRVFARVGEQIHYYPGATAEKPVLLTIDSNETNLVGIDFQIP